MATKKLARRLGIIRKHSNENEINIRQTNGQLFEYFIVLDFESTCWKDSKYRTQEIIEFPAILMNARTGVIEDEFHRYLLPQENPILSDFCKELTGITQAQVDGGIPLSLCLSQFSRWTDKLRTERNVSFDADAKQKIAFITWSDWDLSVCLQYECRRKQLRKPPVLNSWIDLRATYRRFYSRRPNGLNGALKDVGLVFEGREHSGLEDARNTARLAHKMMIDGCVLTITKTLNTAPVSTGLPQSACVQRPVAINGHQLSTTGSASTSNSCTSPIDKRQFKKHTISSPASAKCDCNAAESVTCTCHKKLKCDASNIAAEIVLTSTESPAKSTLHYNENATVVVSNSDGEQHVVSANRSVLNDITNSHANVLLSVSLAGDTSALTSHSRLSMSSLNKTWNRTGAGQENASGMKKTPPLCLCGRRAHRKVVQTAGENQGRVFYCCPRGRCSSGNTSLTGCKFFLWESQHELNCLSNVTFMVNSGASFVNVTNH